MQIGEERKEGNRFQDLSALSQAAQSPTRRRNKALSHSLPQNLSTWHYFTCSRSKSGSCVSSEKSATTSATRTSFIVTIKVLSHLPTIQNTTLVQSISTS